MMTDTIVPIFISTVFVVACVLVALALYDMIKTYFEGD